MRIRRGLASRALPCGCVAGVYETYGGEIVVIVDSRGAGCTDASHISGKVIPTPDPVDHPRPRHGSSRS